MSHEVVMPQLGLSMDSGEIIEWVKQTGDQVKIGDVLFVVESDKAAVDVEAVAAGVLHILHHQKSGPIPVGQVVGYILAEGEPLPDTLSSATASVPTTPVTEVVSQSVAVAPVTTGQPESAPSHRRRPSSPAARRLARELNVDWQQATPTGTNGCVKVRDVEALVASLASAPRPATDTVRISPLAQRLVEAYGLDLQALAERYPHTRIKRDHVEAMVRQMLKQADAPADPLPQRPTRREAMSSTRRTIARRMHESWQTNAPVTLTTEAIASELVRIRTQMKADPALQYVPSYNALLAKLTALALLEYPALNASIEGDEIVYHPAVHMGVAVDTERGLIVPVINSVDTRTLREVSLAMDDLLPRAAAGKADPDELQGGTFTLTNLGKYEIDFFTPIINPPECAVLGIGRLKEKIIPVDGQPSVETVISLSLTFDHRLVDGAPAAQFLQRVKHSIEHPYSWLV
ncbi:MAG: 2-oxo acid dehydrogenase subunit E2 [Chloroflexi bacterium]|nr:2-oxo acid dehydrogenase subunit E2 [Chloroflexota bacterium]